MAAAMQPSHVCKWVTFDSLDTQDGNIEWKTYYWESSEELRWGARAVVISWLDSRRSGKMEVGRDIKKEAARLGKYVLSFGVDLQDMFLPSRASVMAQEGVLTERTLDEATFSTEGLLWLLLQRCTEPRHAKDQERGKRFFSGFLQSRCSFTASELGDMAELYILGGDAPCGEDVVDSRCAHISTAWRMLFNHGIAPAFSVVESLISLAQDATRRRRPCVSSAEIMKALITLIAGRVQNVWLEAADARPLSHATVAQDSASKRKRWDPDYRHALASNVLKKLKTTPVAGVAEATQGVPESTCRDWARQDTLVYLNACWRQAQQPGQVYAAQEDGCRIGYPAKETHAIRLQCNDANWACMLPPQVSGSWGLKPNGKIEPHP